ncbi:uncharacterized protein UV8b_06054 [Ustilaginoidea virens]|uniref:Fatty acid hydroxylase domain-containing protein n=1 Tax=Ustilaginoidea virens TaxID=1159556 RepID=A0A8E5MIQ5_USTVR|nr:uncharacterized protein UV8b_06054 [Ustilaginoidea virens]QUC21813.1 hypothetical protein UV8b_06054 [Ustilaginoidea virens]
MNHMDHRPMATSSHPPPQKHTLINGVSDYTLSLIVPVVTHWLTAAVVGAFVVAVVGSGMTLREGMVFSAFSSFKSCTDHSGYALPWNPVDILTTVDAGYHDKHHQRWGLKKNFALHFRFWDRLWGTEFTDEQVACQLYARDRQAAEMKKSKIKAS